MLRCVGRGILDNIASVWGIWITRVYCLILALNGIALWREPPSMRWIISLLSITRLPFLVPTKVGIPMFYQPDIQLFCLYRIRMLSKGLKCLNEAKLLTSMTESDLVPTHP